MSVNKVLLLGNCGRDPEIRETNGGKVATFSLATTDRGYTKQDGTQVPERTEWHNIVMWGKNAEIAERYIRKGTLLYIEGKLRTRKYTDRNNVDKYVTEVNVDVFELLGKPKEGQSAQQTQAPMPSADDLPFGDAKPNEPYPLW